MERIAAREKKIEVLQDQIEANKENLRRIQSSGANPSQKTSALQGTIKVINRLNGEIDVLIVQIKELELQEDIIEIIPPLPEPIDSITAITPAGQQNGFNLKNLAIIGAVILLLG
ncbi:MAG: hypothetical protein V3U54_13395 [Thermodesulfobacteriota bacterium]